MKSKPYKMNMTRNSEVSFQENKNMILFLQRQERVYVCLENDCSLSTKI